MIRKFHPDKIPILLNKNRNSKLKQFDNNKYWCIYPESSSSSPSRSSSSSWSSRRNCRSTTPRPSTYSPATPSCRLIRHWRVSTRSMPTTISFCIWPIVSMLHLANQPDFDNVYLLLFVDPYEKYYHL